MPRHLCLWLPNWPIQRQNVARSTELDKTAGTETASKACSSEPPRPLLLWHTDPRRGRLVAACCELATDHGVRLGMPIAGAVDVLARCHPSVLPHDREADRLALTSLAFRFQSTLCPRVSLEVLERFKWSGRHRHDPECLVFDLQGVTHLFGAETDLLAAAARVLSGQGYRGRFGIADTLGAAWGLANFARTHAAATANPHAFFIAAPDQAANALAGLPCAALRLSPDHINTLRRLGIDRIEQLLSLPRDGLATRLGSQLCQRIAQALGEVQETVDTLESVLDLNASIEMDYPTDAEDILHDRLQRLTHQVTTRLRVEDKGILQMNLVIRQTDHPSVRAQIGLFAPTLETTHLSTLLVGALQQQRLQSKVTALELSVNLTGALETEQASLFEPTASSADVDETGSLDTNRWNHDPQVSRLIDTLRGRLGDDAVTRVQLDHNVLPESAYQRKATRTPMLKRPRAARKSRGVVSHEPSPASQATRMPSRARSHLPHRDDAGRRPLQLLNPAQPIMPLVPPGQQLSPDQFPNRFRYRGRVWIVSHHWGPERIETDWWRGPLIRRDYFRLELNDGVRWWVYRDLTIADPMAEKQVPSEDSSASHVIAPWMLHGFFD